jgi:hypothetical protein
MRRTLHAFFLLAISIFFSEAFVYAQTDTPHMAAGGSSSSLDYLPSAPEPADNADQDRRKEVPWMGVVHYGRFSRVAVGADISPLGIGIKGATILNEKIDLRLMGNFLSISGSYGGADDIKNVGGTLHMASLQTAVDYYPLNSVWRVSAGLLLWNGNQITAHGTEAGGTSFALPYCANGEPTCSPYQFRTYYSSKADPFTMDAMVNMHPRQPAFTVSGGFGRFIPRSQRHWSFPAEYGVVFMGAPTIKFTPSGMVCTDKAAVADCSDAATDQAFLNDLQTYQTRLQNHGLNHITIWPIFSYGVMYSFNTGR